MERITQSVAKRVLLKAYLSSDHISAATGKTIAVTISKNGAAFGNPNAGATNATEIGSGWYYVDLDSTDTGTAGPLVVLGSEGTVDPVEIAFSVEVALATASALATVDTVVDAIQVETDKLADTLEDDGGTYRFTANALEEAPTGGGSAPTAAEIADAVWDEATAGHTTSGTFGEQLKTDVDAILEDTGTTLQGELDGIQADTEDIQSRLPAALVSGRMSSDAVAISGSTTAADNVEANIGNLDAPVSTVDTVADAIKAKTDSLTFTSAGFVDANVQKINDVTIVGDGDGTPFGV